MILLTLVGTIGVMLIANSMTGWIHLPTRSRLKERMGSVPGESLAVLDQHPLLDRALGWLVVSSVRRLRALLPSADDAIRLRRAGFPSPYGSVEDLYAWKILLSLTCGGAGMIFGLFLGAGGALFGLLILSVVGFLMPDLHLRQAAQRREEEIIAEMSFVLDRIAIQLAAGRTLPVVLGLIAEGPGGSFTKELRQVARSYHSGVDLIRALEEMAERNLVEEIDRFVARLTVSLRRGTNLSDALQVMARTTREKLEARTLARGLVNSALMPIPLGLVLMLGLGLTIVGPAVYLALRTLG